MHLSSRSAMTLPFVQLDAYPTRASLGRPVALDVGSLSKLHHAHLMAFHPIAKPSIFLAWYRDDVGRPRFRRAV